MVDIALKDVSSDFELVTTALRYFGISFIKVRDSALPIANAEHEITEMPIKIKKTRVATLKVFRDLVYDRGVRWLGGHLTKKSGRLIQNIGRCSINNTTKSVQTMWHSDRRTWCFETSPRTRAQEVTQQIEGG